MNDELSHKGWPINRRLKIGPFGQVPLATNRRRARPTSFLPFAIPPTSEGIHVEYLCIIGNHRIIF
jgi:hypothetical protein